MYIDPLLACVLGWQYCCGILPLQAAIIVAVLNIQIPLLLGDLVNVVATLEPGLPMRDYFDHLFQPGLRLAVNYLAQVREPA